MNGAGRGTPYGPSGPYSSVPRTSATADGQWHSFAGAHNSSGSASGGLAAARGLGNAGAPALRSGNPGETGWRSFAEPHGSVPSSPRSSTSASGQAGPNIRGSGANIGPIPSHAPLNVGSSRFGASAFGNSAFSNSRFSSNVSPSSHLRSASSFQSDRMGLGQGAFGRPFNSGFGVNRFGLNGSGLNNFSSSNGFNTFGVNRLGFNGVNNFGFGFNRFGFGRFGDGDFDDFGFRRFGFGCFGCGFGFGGFGFGLGFGFPWGWGSWGWPAWGWGGWWNPLWSGPWHDPWWGWNIGYYAPPAILITPAALMTNPTTTRPLPGLPPSDSPDNSSSAPSNFPASQPASSNVR
jgi:hypothetical protein